MFGSWFQILLAWLIFAGSLDAVPPGSSAESPPILVTLNNGRKFIVTIKALAQ